MPAKKKSKKRHSKKKPARKASKSTRARSQAARKKPAGKKAAGKRASKKPIRKRTAPKDVSKRRNRTARNQESELQREFRGRTRAASGVASNRTSSDFGGLPRAEEADSESVDELVEEGNVFEAGVVAGVQEADDSDEREVRTREVPEDDVPEEYLDRD